MSYTAEIKRTNPACFLFLIDQSGSMADDWGGSPGKKKADGLATIINRLLQELILACPTDAEAVKPRDYFSVGVIGYGANVGPAFIGPLAGRELVPISEVAEKPARLEERSKQIDDGAGGLVSQTVRFPIWFDATANHGTPMCQALARAQNTLTTWLSQHQDSFPPIVVNITDGESTDGDPTTAAESLKTLRTNDGGVLLLNVHLSSKGGEPILFPDSDNNLPDQYAKLLFQMSSPLTDGMKARATQKGITVGQSSKGFAFNADLKAVIQFLEIGTRPTNLR
jgi:hypothetical protein